MLGGVPCAPIAERSSDSTITIRVNAFYPPPKVNSAVVRIIPRPPITPASDPKYLDRLLTLGFATKRKMLRNNLISEIERDRLVLILESMGINAQVRAEDLDVAQWVALSEAVINYKQNL